jgi:hypothetical protein
MEVNMVRILAFGLISVFLLYVTIENAFGISITKNAAVDIAKRNAIKAGVRIEKKDVQVKKYNKPQNDCVPGVGRKANDKLPILKELEGKEYWMVLFTQQIKENQLMLGGSYCIFIDANTGEILKEIKGK